MNDSSTPPDEGGGGSAVETVLIVDDQAELADLYGLWLDDYTVRTATDGPAALDALAADPEPDVVLLDRRMPGMSGDAVLDEMQARGYDGQVVLVTAAAPALDILEMGFDDYVQKPVDRETIRSLVTDLEARAGYDQGVRELFSIASKRAHLQAEKPPAVLEDSDAYQDLEERIRALERETRRLAVAMDDGDVAAVLRRVDVGPTVGADE